jgi:hypothetical protein
MADPGFPEVDPRDVMRDLNQAEGWLGSFGIRLRSSRACSRGPIASTS